MTAIEVPVQNWVYTPTQDTLLNIAVSTAAWTLLYNLILLVPIPTSQFVKDKKGKEIPLPKKEILDVQNRAVSFIHGSLSAILCFISINYEQVPYGSPNTSFQNLALTLSLGYFLYDTLAMTYYKLLDAPMLFHHTIVCLGMYLGLCFNASAAEILSGLFISEVSNPVMHFRLIIR